MAYRRSRGRSRFRGRSRRRSRSKQKGSYTMARGGIRL